MTSGRMKVVLGTTMALAVLPPVLGTAVSSARTGSRPAAANRAVVLHRGVSRWHLGTMDASGARSARANRQIHSRFPWAAPFSDRALGGQHMMHSWMERTDTGFLASHERWGRP